MGGKGDPVGIVQERKFDHTDTFMYKPKSVRENEIHKVQ